MSEPRIVCRYRPAYEEEQATRHPINLHTPLQTGYRAYQEQRAVSHARRYTGVDVVPIVVIGTNLEEVRYVADLKLDPRSEFVEERLEPGVVAVADDELGEHGGTVGGLVGTVVGVAHPVTAVRAVEVCDAGVEEVAPLSSCQHQKMFDSILACGMRSGVSRRYNLRKMT